MFVGCLSRVGVLQGMSVIALRYVSGPAFRLVVLGVVLLGWGGEKA